MINQVAFEAEKKQINPLTYRSFKFINLLERLDFKL